MRHRIVEELVQQNMSLLVRIPGASAITNVGTIVKISVSQVTPQIVERVRAARGQSIQSIARHIQLMGGDPQVTYQRISAYLLSVTDVDAYGQKRKPISAQ